MPSADRRVLPVGLQIVNFDGAGLQVAAALEGDR
jgi:hypothetical protein